MQLYSYSGLLRHLDSSNISFFQWAALSFPSTDGFANDKQGLHKWSRWDSRPRCWWPRRRSTPRSASLSSTPWTQWSPGEGGDATEEGPAVEEELIGRTWTGRSPRATVVPIANPPTTKQRVFSSTRFLFFKESHPWGSCLISVFIGPRSDHSLPMSVTD